MSRRHLRALWNDVREPGPAFSPDTLADLPEFAQRYLRRAIAPGTPRPHAMRIRGHGEIKLDGAWWPFRAEQVTHVDRGFVWAATARVKGLPVVGFDRLIDGDAAMRWRLLGLFPVVRADGPDIARSAAGRIQGEAVWMPSMLLPPAVRWTSEGPGRARATLSAFGSEAHLDLTLDDDGRPRSVGLDRWGNPDGGEHRWERFGAIFHEEGTFGGFTVPTRFEVGWYFGSDRFREEGAFFRGVIDAMSFR